jgi:hypothetical protein
MKILALILLLTSIAATAHAEMKIDTSLQNQFTYINLAESKQPDATAMLMIENNDDNGASLSGSKKTEPDVSQCVVSNKQFVFCRR